MKIWGLLFFFKKYKIENGDFITILGSVNVNIMTPSTNCCSNPTENVLGGRITHIESPRTLDITSVLLISSGDLILGPKNRFITILTGFIHESYREVARLSLEFIGL